MRSGKGSVTQVMRVLEGLGLLPIVKKCFAMKRDECMFSEKKNKRRCDSAISQKEEKTGQRGLSIVTRDMVVRDHH